MFVGCVKRTTTRSGRCVSRTLQIVAATTLRKSRPLFVAGRVPVAQPWPAFLTLARILGNMGSVGILLWDEWTKGDLAACDDLC